MWGAIRPDVAKVVDHGERRFSQPATTGHLHPVDQLHPRRAAFLTELWALGQEGRVEDLASERLGVESLGFGPLREMIDERI